MQSITCTVKSFVEPTTLEKPANIFTVMAIQPTRVSFAPWNSLSILLPWGPQSQFRLQAAFFDVVQLLRFTHLVHASQSSQVPHQVTCHNMRRTDSKTAHILCEKPGYQCRPHLKHVRYKLCESIRRLLCKAVRYSILGYPVCTLLYSKMLKKEG